MTQPRPLRALLYGRASSDPKKRGRSIKDQFAVSELECADRGWTVVDYYEDRDLSASRRATKTRDQYERLVADIKAGRGDVIVYAEASRTNRDVRKYLDLRDLCMEHGVLWCYDGTVYDMSKASDRRRTLEDVAAAEYEADTIQERTARTARLQALRGGPHAHTPFGYTRRYDEAGHLIGQFRHPEHADVVLDLFERADARESIKSLLGTWRQYRPDAGPAGVRKLLRNRAYIGIRVHHGVEHKAAWDPIVPEPLFWRVQAILDDPARATSSDGRVRHLLTGIAQCAVCREAGDFRDAGLRMRGPQKAYRRTARYWCSKGHVGIGLEMLDAYVEEAVLRRLAAPDMAEAFRPVDDGGELERTLGKVAAVKAQLAQARERATSFDEETGMPLLSVESLGVLERQLLPLLARSEARVRELSAAGDPLVDGLLAVSAEDLDAAWNGLDVGQRRHVLRKVVRVELRKAPRLGRYQTVDGQRVGLLFAGQPGFEGWPTGG